MDQPMPVTSRPSGTSGSGMFATALIWSTPWLVILTIYFTLYSWKPELDIFSGAKPGFITLLGIALFSVTFAAVWTLSKKSRPAGMGGMPQ